MNNSLKIILLLIFCGVCSGAAQDSTTVRGALSEEVKASVSVDKKEIPLNRILPFTVRIEWRGDLSRFEIEEVENPVVTNFEIIGSATSNRVGESAGQTIAVKEYVFSLQPQSLGMGYIEGVIITYTDKADDETRRLVTNRLEVKVIDPLPEPGQTRIPWGIVLPALAAIGIGAVVLWYANKKREEKHRREALEHVVPLEEQYLKELNSAFDIKTTEFDIKEAASSLSRLFRRYLAEKYSIRALEATTDEVLFSLREKNLEERYINETDEILKKCDLTKFAGSVADRSEFLRIYTLLEDILNRNLIATRDNPDDADATNTH